jgi:hypothetical protein
LVVASMQIGLQVNADQNAGWSHSMKNDNSSFERVEELKKIFEQT